MVYIYTVYHIVFNIEYYVYFDFIYLLNTEYISNSVAESMVENIYRVRIHM